MYMYIALCTHANRENIIIYVLYSVSLYRRNGVKNTVQHSGRRSWSVYERVKMTFELLSDVYYYCFNSTLDYSYQFVLYMIHYNNIIMFCIIIIFYSIDIFSWKCTIIIDLMYQYIYTLIIDCHGHFTGS